MKERVMKWLGTMIALGMIALLIGSIIEGNRIEQEKATEEKQQPVTEEKQTVRKYSPNEEAEAKKHAEEVTAPTEETQMEIQKVIPEFLKVYVPFDIENPNDFLKKSLPYVTDNLYKVLEQEQRRGTLTIVKTKVLNVELEPQKEGLEEQWWNADIEVEHTDQDGQTSTSTLAYIIKVNMIDGKWKIDDLAVRSRAWNS
ncbi:hypothetical protein J45TS6_45680 [Paenibacillus sp. J45TS6]|uniref:hypothetical protein n=1 Tax=unclassified Paenibacillus TaxID=185978 RepID=UPI00191E8E8C|nr:MULTISPECIES: hypothetical protein [unclassified Paenibacillus]BCO11084.1 hypothetical protein [Paenibacillus sp.]GIP46109.1 hypothetical protein J45TS6_45680 [Paenibacillus sp. J45TS6]